MRYSILEILPFYTKRGDSFEDANVAARGGSVDFRAAREAPFTPEPMSPKMILEKNIFFFDEKENKKIARLLR